MNSPDYARQFLFMEGNSICSCLPSRWGLRFLFGAMLLLIAGWDVICDFVTWEEIDNMYHDGVEFPRGPRPWIRHPLTFCLDIRFCRRKWTKKRKVEVMTDYRPSDDNDLDDPPRPIIKNAVPREDQNGERLGNCTIAADWQTTYYPNCNSFHELEFGFHSESEPHTSYHNKENKRAYNGTRTRELLEDKRGESMELLGLGTTRDSWKVTRGDDDVVLKTLQIKTRDFSRSIYQHQRIDAVASERLSPSPFILDIYGFCGVSVFNEVGVELTAKTVNKLSAVDRLRYSRDIARGMADIHGLDAHNAMIVHADMRVSNAMFSQSMSTLKIGDFNQAYFLGKNERSGAACGYDMDFPFWKDRFAAPEECLLETKTEETDVYHMGGMFFFLLTGKKPYALNKEDYDNRQELWRNRTWLLPTFPEDVRESRDPDIVAVRKAVNAAWQFDRRDRSTAKDIHRMLKKALLESKGRQQNRG